MARCVLAFIIIAALIIGYDWVFHGYILADTYQATASLWRPEAEMKQYFGWLIAGELVLALAFTLILSTTKEKLSLGRGLCFGFIMGLFLSGQVLIGYAVEPYPLQLSMAWILGFLIEFGLAGILGALILKPRA